MVGRSIIMVPVVLLLTLTLPTSCPFYVAPRQCSHVIRGPLL
jgi:hypothetical protein